MRLLLEDRLAHHDLVRENTEQLQEERQLFVGVGAIGLIRRRSGPTMLVFIGFDWFRDHIYVLCGVLLDETRNAKLATPNMVDG